MRYYQEIQQDGQHIQQHRTYTLHTLRAGGNATLLKAAVARKNMTSLGVDVYVYVMGVRCETLLLVGVHIQQQHCVMMRGGRRKQHTSTRALVAINEATTLPHHLTTPATTHHDACDDEMWVSQPSCGRCLDVCGSYSKTHDRVKSE